LQSRHDKSRYVGSSALLSIRAGCRGARSDKIDRELISGQGCSGAACSAKHAAAARSWTEYARQHLQASGREDAAWPQPRRVVRRGGRHAHAPRRPPTHAHSVHCCHPHRHRLHRPRLPPTLATTLTSPIMYPPPSLATYTVAASTLPTSASTAAVARHGGAETALSMEAVRGRLLTLTLTQPRSGAPSLALTLSPTLSRCAAGTSGYCAR